MEKSLNYFADRLVYDKPPGESVAGGLKNITDIGVYNDQVKKSLSWCHLHNNLIDDITQNPHTPNPIPIPKLHNNHYCILGVEAQPTGMVT